MPHCFLMSVRNYQNTSQLHRNNGIDNDGPLLTTRSGRVIRRPTAQPSDRNFRKEMRPHSWSGLPIVTRYLLLQRGSRLRLMEDCGLHIASMHAGDTQDTTISIEQRHLVVKKTPTPTELVQTTMPIALPTTSTSLPPVFNCVQCNRVFASLAAFNAHQRVHYKPTKYLCPYCPKVFARSWLLKGHLRVHTGERPFHCHYEGCNKAFADRSNLRAHELIHTQSSKRWKCPVCGKLFAQKRYLHKHLTEVCKGAMGRRMEAVLVQVPTPAIDYKNIMK
uniref:C2H2-type domain-containing protein n=1 Tax=Strigamia maritima TaxID=126957 RepID=T1IYF8_STRMM